MFIRLLPIYHEHWSLKHIVEGKSDRKKIIKRETDKLSTCFAFNQDDLKVFLGCWHGQLCRGSFHKCTSYWSFVVKTVPQYFPFLFLNRFFFVVFFCRIACSVWWQFLEVITTEGMKDGWRQMDYGVLMLTDWSWNTATSAEIDGWNWPINTFLYSAQVADVNTVKGLGFFSGK